MNREIKFRQPVFNKKGDFVRFSYWGIFKSGFPFGSPEPVYKEVQHGFNERYGHSEQYTGLKDRSGVEIYEGDILEIEIEMISNLFYEDSNFEKAIVSVAYNDNYMRFEYVSKSGVIGFIGVIESEVIGNIHENPELIKQ